MTRYIHDIKRWAMYSYYFRVSQYWHVMPCEGTAKHYLGNAWIMLLAVRVWSVFPPRHSSRKAQGLALLDVQYEVADDPWFVHSLLWGTTKSDSNHQNGCFKVIHNYGWKQIHFNVPMISGTCPKRDFKKSFRFEPENCRRACHSKPLTTWR